MITISITTDNQTESITIPESKVQRTMQRHMAARPKPDGKTSMEWLLEGIIYGLRKIDRRGKKILALESLDNADMLEE